MQVNHPPAAVVAPFLVFYFHRSAVQRPPSFILILIHINFYFSYSFLIQYIPQFCLQKIRAISFTNSFAKTQPSNFEDHPLFGVTVIG